MALEGSLQDMSLIDLFQIFRMSSKTGTLLLDEKNRCGVIYVIAGRLIDAIVVRKLDRRVITVADDAVLHLLCWEDATFVFRHDLDTSEHRTRIIRDSEQLVIESVQRREQAGQVSAYQQVTLDSHLALNAAPGGVESSITFSLDQWRILSLISDYDTLRELCFHSSITAEQGLGLASQLVAIGVLDIVSPLQAKYTRNPVSAACQQKTQGLRGTTQHLVAAASRSTLQRPLLQAVMRRVRSL